MKLRHASLFSGIGGFDLAAEWVGWDNVFTCEINEFCNKVLKKNFPKTVRYSDIRNLDGTKYEGRIDVITGGVPCQPFSKAGKMRGSEDERYLWDQYARILREIKPRWTVAENVPGLIAAGNGEEFSKIANFMETAGYEILPLLLPASAFGAQHARERLFIIGRRKVGIDTNTTRGELGAVCEQSEEERSQHGIELFREFTGFSWFQTISQIHREDNGVPGKLDRRRNAALGNAIVPHIAYIIFRTIDEFDNKQHQNIEKE